ncbi:hypothetical protein RI367_001941 [Sorochytrium milnesiophthora]
MRTLLVLTLLLAVCLQALAVPAKKKPAAPAPAAIATPSKPKAMEISTALKMHLERVLRYSIISYCHSEYTIKNWICEPYCKDVQGDGFKVFDFIYSSANSEIRGFVAFNEAEHRVIVSYRGSQNVGDWFNNIDVWPKSIPSDLENMPPGYARDKGWPAGAKVHRGFWRMYNHLRSDTIAAIEKFCASCDCRAYSVSFTGHSLGGVLAPLAAADPKMQHIVWKSKEVVTLNAPKAGNSVLAKHIDTQVQHIYRVVEGSDLTPRLPGKPYAHTKGEIWSVGHVSTGNIALDCTAPDGSAIECSTAVVGFASTRPFSYHNRFFGKNFSDTLIVQCSNDDVLGPDSKQSKQQQQQHTGISIRGAAEMVSPGF